jgi:hypothetical protein
MQIFSILLLWSLGPSAMGSYPPCSPSACWSLFSFEFDESKLVCNTYAESEGHEFDLTFARTPTLSSNSYAYTAECQTAIRQQGACVLKGIKDSGFQITTSEAVFASLGVFFELLSAFQIVSLMRCSKPLLPENKMSLNLSLKSVFWAIIHSLFCVNQLGPVHGESSLPTFKPAPANALTSLF